MCICMSRCSFKSLLLFCFSMESSHFLAASSTCGTLQNCFSSIFDLGPLTPKIYSPKFGTKSQVSLYGRYTYRRCLGLLGGFRGWPIQWNHKKFVGPTLVVMAMKFWQIWDIFCTKSPISRLVCLTDRLCLGLPGGPTTAADPCCHGSDICARRGV